MVLANPNLLADPLQQARQAQQMMSDYERIRQYAVAKEQINRGHTMLRANDVIIREVAVGYLVIVTGKQTEEAKTYVATDPDSLADTLKLAMVSRAMNAAR